MYMYVCKTATVISQNGEDIWSERRQPMVKMATTNGHNGDIKGALYRIWCRVNTLGDSGVNVM